MYPSYPELKAASELIDSYHFVTQPNFNHRQDLPKFSIVSSEHKTSDPAKVSLAISKFVKKRSYSIQNY